MARRLEARSWKLDSRMDVCSYILESKIYILDSEARGGDGY